MSWFNAIKSAGTAMRSELDNMLTSAEERTPNLDAAPGWFSPNPETEAGDNGGAVNPRRLSQGDKVSAVAVGSDEVLNGIVFSVDKRNELVVIIPDGGGFETVLFSEARFYEEEKDASGGGSSGAYSKNSIRREDMEEGVIYDAEVID